MPFWYTVSKSLLWWEGGHPLPLLCPPPSPPSWKILATPLVCHRDANHFNVLSGNIGLRIREVFIQFNGSSQYKNQGGIEISAAIHTKIIQFSGSLSENQGGLASLLSLRVERKTSPCPNITKPFIILCPLHNFSIPSYFSIINFHPHFPL